jgi:peptidylprolyl isomerase
MFNKFELIGAGASVMFMALAIYLTQVESALFSIGGTNQASQVIATENPSVVIVSEGDNQIRVDAFLEASDSKGNFERMVIDDIKIGTGEEVQDGDMVSVHYIGTLQNGTEFDNSRKRGQPFEFQVGKGMVIKGWDEGVIGMKIGGQRVLVIPPEKAYGEQGIGPIPGNSTLVFAIELVDVKK